MAFSKGKKVIALGGAALTAYGGYLLYDRPVTQPVVIASEIVNPKRPSGPLPTRAELVKTLQTTPEYDVLIIGGGATGCGVAVDTATRGLKTALVEYDDYSSGTSSRSTKLIHGGVRYLQKAIMRLDYDQYKMVKEALHERYNLLKIAPHLAEPLPIMLPIYKWWQVPYFWVGIKAYDFVAGSQCISSSYFLSKTKALEQFPMLQKDKLVGALVYYDGQQNDARMNLSLAITAIRSGGTVLNHMKAVSLLKKTDENGNEKVCGARVKDMLSGHEWDVKAKCVINATGPFTDSIRTMDNPEEKKICQPSAGIHIILPDYYSPATMGLLDPSTSDGRVIFFLPWQKHTIAGTTDRPCAISHSPSPTEEEIQFILKEIKKYLTSNIEVRRGDVLSAWCGIRPLVLDPSKPNTESIARNHIIDVSQSGLITIAGGKWTTYRSMAEETVDAAIKHCNLKPKNDCVTNGLLLEGAHAWSPTVFIRLVQDFGLESEVASNLSRTYGDRAFAVAKLANLTGKRWPVVGCRLHEEFPYIEAEVKYACYEYAVTAVDVIARRLRLAFLNVQAAEESLPKIISIMAEQLNWSKAEQKVQLEKAMDFLQTEMGKNVNKELRAQMPINFSPTDINLYIKKFQSLDKDRKGYITVNDLRRYMKSSGEKIAEADLHNILNEVDLNKNGQVELSEYLQLMYAIKTGSVTQSRLAKAAEWEYDHSRAVPVERSGGGL